MEVGNEEAVKQSRRNIRIANVTLKEMPLTSYRQIKTLNKQAAKGYALSRFDMTREESEIGSHDSWRREDLTSERPMTYISVRF